MNREDAYFVGLVALDGLGAERLVPLVEEGSDVGGVLVDEIHEVIVEGTDVSALVGEALKAEDSVETLGEVVEGQGAEVVEMGDICLGQESVEG